MVFILFIALATLKPQAGLVAPQAVPVSQPSAAVSYRLLVPANKMLMILKLLLLSFLTQGAGGEPMEISEQVGMTPEIIQKVCVSFLPLSLIF